MHLRSKEHQMVGVPNQRSSDRAHIKGSRSMRITAVEVQPLRWVIVKETSEPADNQRGSTERSHKFTRTEVSLIAKPYQRSVKQ